MNFTQELTKWYENNQRNLPWRKDKDPYKVWLSEVILQQTRVEQGWSYFEKFVEAYPGIRQMADAPEEEILKHWQGLGYYSRAKNMHHTAKFVAHELNGAFPNTYDEIVKLKGVGPYTAAAISSIAFQEPIAAIDGNVLRVYARLFGIEDPIDQPSGRNAIQKIASEMLNRKRPGDFNQALMDFGSSICSPKRPRCEECPLLKTCVAHSQGKVDKLPFKQGKTKVRKLYVDYMVIQHRDEFIVRKRDDQSIWKNLYDYPSSESMDSPSAKAPTETIEEWGYQPHEVISIAEEASFNHKLSHRNIFAKFWSVNVSIDKLPEVKDQLQWVHRDHLAELPLPRLIDKFWNNYTNGKE